MKIRILVAILGMLLCIIAQAEISVLPLSEKRLDDISLAPQLVQEKKLNSPKIVLWYFGPRGVYNKCVQFYKTGLLDKLNSENISFQQCYLYDLAAWNALRNLNAQIDQASEPALYLEKDLNKSKLNKYCPVYSKDFFASLEQLTDKQIQYIQKSIIPNRSVWKKSIGKTGSIKVRDILKKATFKKLIDLSCKASQEENNDKGKNEVKDEAKNENNGKNESNDIGTLGNLSTEAAYSFLQYLEGIMLIKKLVDQGSSSSDILFLLPNNELKYFQDEAGTFLTFTRDINAFFDLSEKDPKINVYLQNFNYGNGDDSRPYLLENGTKDNKVAKTKLINFFNEKR